MAQKVLTVAIPTDSAPYGFVGTDLDVAVGEVIANIGKSGSGKSTLLRCINGLEVFDEGSLNVSAVCGAPKICVGGPISWIRPACIKTTRSDTLRAKLISCVTMSSVMPCRRRATRRRVAPRRRAPDRAPT